MTTVATLPLIDAKEVQRSLTILLDQNQVVELRALNATTQLSKYPYTASGYFNDPAILTKELYKLRSATGIYITLQPCKQDLMARAENRLRTANEMKGKSNSRGLSTIGTKSRNSPLSWLGERTEEILLHAIKKQF